MQGGAKLWGEVISRTPDYRKFPLSDSLPVFCWRIRFRPFAASGLQMPPLKVFFALAALASIGPQTASAQENPGALGAEGEPGRMQQWRVPTPAQDTLAHALLFRPPGDGPFALAVIAHATTQNL